MVTASKGGFVSLQYGQRRPSESGTPLDLGDGQVLDKHRDRAAARQRDHRPHHRRVRRTGSERRRLGDALRLQAGARACCRARVQNSRDTTDDQGQFRLFGLSPGEYLVSAALSRRR